MINISINKTNLKVTIKQIKYQAVSTLPKIIKITPMIKNFSNLLFLFNIYSLNTKNDIKNSSEKKNKDKNHHQSFKVSKVIEKADKQHHYSDVSVPCKIY